MLVERFRRALGGGIRRLAAAAAVLALCAGAARASEQGGGLFTLSPENIGPSYSGQVDDLYRVILWLVTGAFVLTEGLLLLFLVRFRAKPGGRAVYTRGNHRLEVVWTLVPGAILFWLALYQIGAWRDIKVVLPPPEKGLVVQCMAKQFEWHFRYAGPDGKFDTDDDVLTLNFLHVPVDTNVTVQLRTQDVLHSFFLPNIRLKQDTVPGLTINQWFLATKTTETARKELKERLESQRDSLGDRVLKDLRTSLAASLATGDRKPGDISDAEVDAALGKALAEKPLDVRITEWIEAKAASFTFEIACAELCGLGHTRMRGFLVVHSKEDFLAWVDRAYVEEAREYGKNPDNLLNRFWPATENKLEDVWLRDNWPADLKAKWPPK